MRNWNLFVIGGFSLWVMGAAIDSFLSGGSFLNFLIFGVPSNLLLFRLATIGLFALIGIIVCRTSMDKLAVQELRDSQARYRSVLDHLPVGVYRTTSEGRILEANRKFAEILGYQDARDLQTVNLNDIYVKRSDRMEHLQKLRESTVFAEFELRRKDGGTTWIRDYPKAVLDKVGNIAYIDGAFVESSGIDAIMRDMSEHRRLETMKDQFISAAMHELRTPLVSIKGYVDYIIAKESRAVPENVKSKIEVVRRNTDRLLELTDDLLDIQRMESGRLELKLQTVNIREILTECIEEIQPLLKQKNQQISADIPAGSLLIESDRLRLGEVLRNLLYNAIKFTPDGGRIAVHVSEDHSTIAVHVTDTGIGIEKKDLERVFEPFAVIEKPTYFKGTGLGLSLTKRLVEAHRGRIWASSPGKGQGATFAFSLPKKKEWVEIHG